MTTNKTHSHTHEPLSRWLISHVRAMRFSFNEFIRTPFSNLITICVIGIALSLPLGFLTVLQNLQKVDTLWGSSTPTISLYLKSDTTNEQTNTLIAELRRNNDISEVSYISPEQGLATFQKNTLLGDAVKLFQKNPLPGVIVVTPIIQNHDAKSIQLLYQTLKQSPEVDVAQLDMDWVTRLFDVITIGKNFANALSLLFGFGVILIIGHTLRSSLASHANEIKIMKLMGATNAYIRRPLLYRGILYGILGGIVSITLVSLFLSELNTPVSQLAQTYQTAFQLNMISLGSDIVVLMVSSLFGLVGAWITTTQFLSRPEQVD